MIRFLLALLIAFAPAVHAAASTQCPDGTFVETSTYPASCGANVIGLNPSVVGATSITFEATTNITSGTAYLSVTLSSTAPHWDSVRDGTLDECSASATVTAGTFSITCSGLATATSYCGNVTQLKDGIPSLVDNICTTTTPAPPPGGGGGVTITAPARFAGTGGSDANSGLAHATRWLNPPTTALSTGMDMWFFDNTTYSNKKAHVTWNGTPTDYVRMGTYCMDGSTPKEYPFSSCQKVKFNGGLDPAKFANGQNCYSTSCLNAANLASEADAYIASYADYVEIQDFIQQYSAGYGITVNGLGTAASTHHNIIQDNEIYNVGRDGIVALDGVQDVVIRRNVVDYYGTCMQQLVYGYANSIFPVDCGFWGAGMTVAGVHGSGALAVRTLFENNTVLRGMGEGIDAIRARYVIIRGNKVSNTWAHPAYADASSDIVWENNILVGSKKNLGYVNASYVADWGGGSTSSEDFQLPQARTNQIDHLWRNNLTVDLGDDLVMGLESASEAAGKKLGLRGFHNTHISSKYGGIKSSAVSASITYIDIRNSLIWNTDLTTSTICQLVSATNVTFVDNGWTVNPAVSGCDGTGDEYGTLGIGSITYAAWDAFGNGTWPSLSDAVPSGALGPSATKLTTALLDKDLYGFAYDQIAEVLNATITEANWECQACLTANNLVRNATTYKGAMGQ